MSKHHSKIIAIFIIAFIAQLCLWTFIPFVDGPRWESRAQFLIQDIHAIGEPVAFFHENGTYRYAGHPGMSFTSLAAIAISARISPKESLTLAVSILNAFSITSAILVAARLERKPLWAIAVGAILLSHTLYYFATPPTATVGPIIVLISLLTLLQSRGQAREVDHVAWAIALGVGFATRTTTMLIYATPFIVWYIYTCRKQQKISMKGVVYLSAIGVATYTLFNPLIWLDPVGHISQVLYTVESHAIRVYPTGFSSIHIYTFAPLTIVSSSLILLASLIPRVPTPLSRPTTLGLLVYTVFILAVFMNVSARSIRHFFPLLLIWEVLLPLSLYKLTTSNKTQWGITGLIVAAHVFLLCHTIYQFSSLTFRYVL